MKKEIELGDIVTAKFASINKNDCLDTYKEECAKEEKTEYTNWRMEKCKVEGVFTLNQDEWDDITNSFLDENILYRGKGGAIYTGDDKRLIDSDKEFHILLQDRELLAEFRKNNANLVTILINKNTDETIAVNPEGYGYARYVGIEVTK